MDKQIIIAGIGTDGNSTLTQAAKSAIEQADVLIGAARMLAPFEELNKPCFMSYISSEIAAYINECEYTKIVILMSGDCGFYSGAEKLLELLKGSEVEIICGISSVVYFGGKIKMPWQDFRFISLHGKNANIVRSVCANEKVMFVLGGDNTAAEICLMLCEYGLNDAEIYLGENLSYDDERIRCGKAEDFISVTSSALSLMAVINKRCEKFTPFGIPNDKFIRGNVPMTKSEVRAVCISKLKIGRESICWDIGCGTGSVSVEMALQAADGKVYAVDRKAEAILLTEKNKRIFGCDNVITVEDNAEKAVNSLPAPDCVFVGGSGGKLRDIVEEAYRKNPYVRMIITAVSLETLNEAVKICDDLQVKINITQLAVTRTEKKGGHTMFAAENPIFIIGVTKTNE